MYTSGRSSKSNAGADTPKLESKEAEIAALRAQLSERAAQLGAAEGERGEPVQLSSLICLNSFTDLHHQLGISDDVDGEEGSTV